MANPILFAVDDDASVLAQLRRELGGRYGADYQVLTEPSARIALERIEELGAGGEHVALFIADQWMPEMTGLELLTRVHDYHPQAKRALLIDFGDQSTAEPILRGTALGRIDYHLYKPWEPADAMLHPLIGELLAEWTKHHRGSVELFRLVGDQWDARTHELRDLLQRNPVTYGFYDKDSDEGRKLIHDAGVEGEDFPVVILHNGTALVRPANVDLAAAVGSATSAPAELCEVAIIGAGPAGLAAAVYGTSEGLSTVVVECEAIGGQAGTSSLIRNYLGFPRGLSGADLADRAYQQAWLFGAEFVLMQKAVALRPEGDTRVVTLADGSELRARAVVLATGVSYRRLGIESIDSLLGAGVFYGAATAEAKAMKGQEVYLVGAGNSAGQAAVHLSKYAARVTMLVRGESLKATMSAYLIQEIERTANIDVRVHTEVTAGRGDHRLEGLVLQDRRTGETEIVPAVALFILIGAVPNTAWLADAVERDENGFILTGPDLSKSADGTPASSSERPPLLLETSIPGVFAAGDVRHRSVKRVASAVGEGAMAISFVHQHLEA